MQFSRPDPKPGYFGFRGDIALKFQTQLADEKRPPEYSLEAVAAVTKDGESTIPVLIGYLHNFAHLKDVWTSSVRAEPRAPISCIATTSTSWPIQGQVGGIPFFILPLDESTSGRSDGSRQPRQERRQEARLGGKLQA